MTRKIINICLMLCLCLAVQAQDKKQAFSAQEFQAKLEQHIVKEARLTQQEADAFLPLYREMHSKQRVIMNKLKQLSKTKTDDEKECRKLIKTRNDYEIELKKIQQTYHNKIMEVISPCKLCKILKAEDSYHRSAFRKWGQTQNTKEQKKGPRK